MSRPPSRSSSVNVPSRNTAPLYVSAGTATPSWPTHSEHTTTIGHRLRHMFDKERYAVFVANVVIQELGNVPQIDGDFAVKWKFRGRSPKHGEMTASSSASVQGRLTPKASLPNVKLGSMSSKPSDSTLSLRSTSTSSTAPKSPLNPNRSPTIMPSTPKAAGLTKSRTLPPSALSSIPPAKSSPKKKPSDPTPLRQSSGPVMSTIPVESPEQLLVDEPEEDEGGLEAVANKQSSGESSRTGSQSSGTGIPSIGLISPTPANSTFYDQQLKPPGSTISLESTSTPDTPAYNTSTPTLSVPFPKARLTSPSEDKFSRPPSMTRTLSTDGPARSQSSLSIHNLFKPDRQRSTSALSMSRSNSATASSTSRKGTTQNAALHAHSCAWDYELQYPIKIPLTKQVSTSGTATPSSTKTKTGPSSPMLGAGPLSDSGIRLIIEQVVAHRHQGEEWEGREKENKGKERKATMDRVRFGAVDIDLAGFAGKGRTTRRFLLRGSRTNATIRLTVDMKWIGGEENWTAPPMQTGHFVTGMQDLVGETDNLKNDLLLSKTPSNSSTSSQISSGSGLASTSSLAMSRSASNVSLVGPAPNIAYKSFEHHLLQPEPETRRRRTSSKDSRSSTPDGRFNKRSPNLDSIPGTPSITIPDPNSPTIEVTSPKPSSIRSTKFRRTHHHHHSHHFRSTFDLFNSSNQRAHSPHQNWGIQDLSPDVIVEAVWNPRPGLENGPFTFVPQQQITPAVVHETEEGEVLGGEEGVLVDSAVGKDAHGKRAWVRRHRSMRREKTREKIITV